MIQPCTRLTVILQLQRRKLSFPTSQAFTLEYFSDMTCEKMVWRNG